jgi:diguanylate cyclase (GGDEF)-like protein/PAS domain S-box-containing protein
MEFMTHSETLFNIYQSLFNHHHDACYAIDKQGRFQLINDAAVELSGYSKKEVLNMTVVSLVQKHCLEKTMYHFNRVLQGHRETFELAIQHKKGHRLDLSVMGIPIYIDGQICGAVGIAKNITEKNHLETLLSGQNNVLEMIAKGSALPEVLDNIVYLIEKVSNGGMCSILLIDEDESCLIHAAAPHLPPAYTNHINGTKIGPAVGSCGTAAFLRRPVIVTDISTDSRWTDYKEIALASGLQACWSSPVFDHQKQVIATFAMYYAEPSSPTETDIKIIQKATDLTSLAIQHYRAKDKINFMAFHDSLTGLPNRRRFDDRVHTAIHEAQQSADTILGLMYLDLDRFKLVNDSLGHRIGDKLLQTAAQRLKNALGDQGIISRQGGDEFTILLTDSAKPSAKRTAEKILEVLARPFVIEGHEIFVTASIGTSFYPFDGGNAEELMRKADTAMYQAKKKGRNNVQFYDAVLDQQTYRKLEIENELRKAVNRKEFTLHYQPIINLSTNRIEGVEALIRWHNEKLGAVSPGEFIPIAEETGLIVPIGEWVLQTACRQLKRWEQDGIMPLTVSVNLSIRQFYQPNLISVIKTIVNDTKIDPQHLTIEITESMTMDVETATSLLYELKRLGLTICIDDFGTGYSSLNYLKSFPIDYLKIDQSFIQNIAACKHDENISTTIILMAHSLGLKVIAEGVETGEQLQVLQQRKCDEVQGYLFSKPLPADELTQFYARNSGSAADKYF